MTSETAPQGAAWIRRKPTDEPPTVESAERSHTTHRGGCTLGRLLAAGAAPAQSGAVTGRKWNELDLRTRRLIIIAGALESVLKIAALIDLARRPSTEVRGSKARWAAAVTVINSFGAVPIAYFAYGRRKSRPLQPHLPQRS